MSDDPDSLQRLNKFIASATGCSRRKADELIDQQRIKVDGRIGTVGDRVDPEHSVILFDNQRIQLTTGNFTFAFHKPRGYVSSLKIGREQGLPISDLLPPEMHLKPAGRLDTDSEGLLIVSNDGELIYAITHPRFELEKEYLVETKIPFTDRMLYAIDDGILLEDGWCRPDRVDRISANKVSIILHEGRKREIRRLIHAVHNSVHRLIRVRVGKVTLGNLKAGALRPLTELELKSLTSIKKLDSSK